MQNANVYVLLWNCVEPLEQEDWIISFSGSYEELQRTFWNNVHKVDFQGNT